MSIICTLYLCFLRLAIDDLDKLPPDIKYLLMLQVMPFILSMCNAKCYILSRLFILNKLRVVRRINQIKKQREV